MSAATFAERCTQAQRDFIRTLLERAGLSTDRVSYAHRAVFQAACVQEPAFAEAVDVALRDLDRAKADRLIRTLKQYVGIEEEDDD